MALFSTLALLCASCQWQGQLQLAATQLQQPETWLASYQDQGVGLYRFSDGDPLLRPMRAWLQLNAEPIDDWQATVVALYHPDGEQKWGVSEAFVRYQPLQSGWRQQLKLGFFYPGFSLENTDSAWFSPYTYQFSAINSWFAEELRALGGEWSWSRPGRSFNSPHSVSVHLGAFQGNDGLGSLLAWRGFAVHDRQSVANDRVHFAQYPSLRDQLAKQPSWVEPFTETDHRTGYYVGGHWRYLQKSELRWYWYDNLADPTALEASGQYAWHTKMHIVSGLYRVNDQHLLIGQWLYGDTEMGAAVVDNEFESWSLLWQWQWQADQQLAVRVERFKVEDNDQTVWDDNNSDGHSWTLSYQWQWAEHWQLGLEANWLRSDNQTRSQWHWATAHSQRLLQWRLGYRF